MTLADLVAFAAVLLAGGGLGGLIAVLVKSGAERQSIIVGAAEKSIGIQTAVIEALHRENDRLRAQIASLTADNLRLRERFA